MKKANICAIDRQRHRQMSEKKEEVTQRDLTRTAEQEKHHILRNGLVSMSLDIKKCLSQENAHPEVRECISKSTRMDDALPSYEYLYSLKDSIPKELYAYYYRRILQMNTENVSVELRLKMFEGVDPRDIMYQDELDAINHEFGETITVYT